MHHGEKIEIRYKDEKRFRESGWVMDIGEGMCYGECYKVCKPGDSQTCTSGANNTLYVNKRILKRKEKKNTFYCIY